MTIKDKNRFYVYAYLDPTKEGKYKYGSYEFDYEPFYIGKGCGNRLLDHLNGDICNIIKTERIEEIRNISEPIVIKVIDKINETNAFDIEIDLITKIGRIIDNTGPLTNIQKGGEGFSGWVVTDNWIKNNKKGQKKRWANPKNRINHSISLKKVGRRKSFREKSSKNMKQEWANPLKRKKRIEIQKRPDIKRKKSEASIKANSKEWTLISPDNQIYSTNRLKDFCKERDLSVGMLQQVALARILHHKNWLCFKKGKEKETIWYLNLLRLKKLLKEVVRRKKLKILGQGRKKSDEEKRKIGLAQIGNKHGLNYKHSDENKEKISNASKKRWEDPLFREKMKLIHTDRRK